MTDSEKTSEPSLSQSKKTKRRASFLPIDEPETRSKLFKAEHLIWLQAKKLRIRNALLNTKRYVLGLFGSKDKEGKEIRPDWRSLKNESVLWLVEAGVEGFIVNYPLYIFFEFHFSIATVFAYGFVIKETLDIIERIRKNGPTEKKPIEDERS